MLLFFSITGIILSVILIYFNARKYTSAIYLGGFFFLVSLYGITQYVLFYSKSAFLVSIFFLNTGFLSYLTGPVLYFYFRSVLVDHSRLKKKDLWHLVPAVIFFISILPYTFTPYSYKLTVANEIIENLGYLGKFNDTLLNQIFPNALIYLSRPVLVLGYTTWSAVIFIRYLKQKKEIFVLSGQQYMTKWLIVLLGFLFLLLASYILLLGESFANRNSKLFFTLNMLQVLSGIGLAGLLISPFFFPGILYGLPRLPHLPEEVHGETNMVFLSKEIVKKRMPGFESEYLNQVGKKIEFCMKEQQPFLKPDCNMASVSKYIDMPLHHVAYYFREVRKQPFNDYRNELRIEHAKKLIREGKARELTLEAIGLLSGFSTRNTFFKAFKKAEGVSPGTYSSRY
jgi:AraC-like DNA-binding protein